MDNLQKNTEDIIKTEEVQQDDKPSAYGSPLKPLRTYQGDVDEAVSKNKTSLVNIAVAEQKKRITAMPIAEIPREETAGNQGRNKVFTAISLVFFLLGASVLGAIYYFFTTQNSNEPAKNQTGTIIGYSETYDFPIASSSREKLINTILEKREDFNKPVNSILFIDTTKNGKSANIASFANFLMPNMPGTLKRNLNNEYMLGILSFDKNQVFIMFKTDNYGASYAGMIEWEKTMIGDIGRLFSIATTEGTSTPYVFSDKSLKNKDLRIVKNDKGQTVLLYSFLDKNTIVITGAESSFNAIMSKYFTGQMVR